MKKRSKSEESAQAYQYGLEKCQARQIPEFEFREKNDSIYSIFFAVLNEN